MLNKEELMNRILLLEPDLTQALLKLISDYETKMIKLEKQDKMLEILKSQIDIKRGLDTLSKKPIYIIETKKFAFPLSEEKGQLIKEWLENDK